MRSNKLSWSICTCGYIVAILSVFLLPRDVSIRVNGLISGSTVDRIQIFLLPIIQTITLLLSYTKVVQAYIIYYKSGYQKTKEQYYFLIFIAICIMFLIELFIVGSFII